MHHCIEDAMNARMCDLVFQCLDIIPLKYIVVTANSVKRKLFFFDTQHFTRVHTPSKTFVHHDIFFHTEAHQLFFSWNIIFLMINLDI